MVTARSTPRAMTAERLSQAIGAAPAPDAGTSADDTIMTWLAPFGRVLAAFGLGVLAATYFPRLVVRAGLPIAVAGAVALLLGMWARRADAARRTPPPPEA